MNKWMQKHNLDLKKSDINTLITKEFMKKGSIKLRYDYNNKALKQILKEIECNSEVIYDTKLS